MFAIRHIEKNVNCAISTDIDVNIGTPAPGSLTNSSLLVSGSIMPPVTVHISSNGLQWAVASNIFELTIPLLKTNLQIDVDLICQGAVSRWGTIFVTVDLGHAGAFRFWQAVANNDWGLLNLNEHSLIPSRDAEILCADLRIQATYLDTAESVNIQPWISDVLKSLLSEKVAHFRRNDIIKEMFHQPIRNNKMVCEFSDGTYTCDSSLFIHSLNFLRFCSGDRAFFVIQYGYSAIGLYFPDSNISISWTMWHEVVRAWVPELIGHICYLGVHYAKYMDPTAERKFGGFIIGNDRPYHELYDQLTPLIALLNAANQKVTVMNVSYNSWFEIRKLLDVEVDEIIIDSYQDINALNFTNKTFSVIVGGKNIVSCDASTTLQVFDRIAAKASFFADSDPDLSAKIAKLTQHKPIIWFGVQGQKREWVEQVDGIANIISQLYNRFPDLAIVFDGWTSPLAPQPSDMAEISKDEALLHKIEASIAAEIPRISIIGAPSMTKIAIGNKVDAYITNYLQGSIYVDNICRKPGVGHINTFWPFYADYYQHYSCVRIDDSDIVNVDTHHAGPERPDMISYSIPWEKVYAKFRSVLVDAKLDDSGIST